MKKIFIFPILFMLVFSFCSKKEPAEKLAEGEAVELSAKELFSKTMVDMQQISKACAALYKNFNVIPPAASIKELALELAKDEYNKKDDDKSLVELLTGVKSAAELKELKDRESEDLLLELLSKKLPGKRLQDLRDKDSGYLKIKLLLKDTWGNAFYFKAGAENWWIGSAGSDGQFAGFDREGEYKHLDEEGNDISGGKDIIFSGEKGFVLGPEVE